MHDDENRLDARIDTLFWMQMAESLRAWSRMSKDEFSKRRFSSTADMIQREVDKSIILGGKVNA